MVAHSRNRTFHYPYPTAHYPADAELEAALENMGTTEAQWVDEGDGRFRLKFADDVALSFWRSEALSPQGSRRQLELARDGSAAFVKLRDPSDGVLICRSGASTSE